jgi:hypothetical protein
VAELAHAGVDEREAGAALAPGAERLRVVLPVDVARVLDVVDQDVEVEVAPAELTDELVVARALLGLAR